MKRTSPTLRVKQSLNAFLVRNTPKRVLNKLIKGDLSISRKKKLLNRCLNCGISVKSYRYLNEEPVALKYLEVYYRIRKGKKEDFYLKTHNPKEYEALSILWRKTLKEKLEGKPYVIFEEPIEAISHLESITPSVEEMAKGVLSIEHFCKNNIFAISNDNGNIICHTTSGYRISLQLFQFPIKLKI